MIEQMGLEELQELEKNVFDFLKIELIKLNQSGNLKSFLQHIGYLEKNGDFLETQSRQKKVLVIGQSNSKKRDLLKILQLSGFDEEQFDFIITYEDIEKFNFSTLRNSKKYHSILVGPMAHNQKGVGDYHSMVTRLEDDDTMPDTYRIMNNKKSLEITKTSFKNALSYIEL